MIVTEVERGVDQSGVTTIFEQLSPLLEAALRGADPVATVESVLRQYRESLANQAIQEAKDRAGAVIQEELQAFRARSQDRLQALEAEMRVTTQNALDTLSQALITSVQTQLKAAQEQVDAYAARIAGASLPSVVAYSAPAGSQDGATPRKAVADTAPAAHEAATPLETSESATPAGDGAHPQGVWLRLNAPLELKALMGFYHGLSEMTDLRILETAGSAEQGVSLLVLPKGETTVAARVQTIPQVREVRPTTLQFGKGKGAKPSAALAVALRTVDA